ncbi:Haloacid dehalogenase-like hydrolase [Candidatus Norongarragalina meridionalis]|nr:Haloacid dehalogenase-like hydrolase [Candidatus Norongarragalina meridionalis]
MDGTLLDNEKYEKRFWMHDVPEYAAKVTGAKSLKRKMRLLVKKHAGKSDWYRPEFFLRELGVPNADVRSLVRKNMRLVKPLPWARKTLAKLRRTRRLVLLTNSVDYVADEKLRHTKLRKYFSRIFTLDSAGFKGERKTFKKVLAAVRAEPSECVFFTDVSFEATVARSLGIRTHVVKSFSKTLPPSLRKMPE